MNLPIGVSYHTITRDVFVLVVFVIGFALGAFWQYADKLNDANSELKAVITTTAKAEKVSTAVSGNVQTYTEKAVDAGNSYIQTDDGCVAYTPAEYESLGVLIEASNSAIRGASEVPRDNKAKRQER